MVQRKQDVHDTKLSFCERSGMILTDEDGLIQNKEKQVVEFYFRFTNKSLTHKHGVK